MAKEEELLFVGVKEPLELRRTILEASKDVIESLQRYVFGGFLPNPGIIRINCG